VGATDQKRGGTTALAAILVERRSATTSSQIAQERDLHRALATIVMPALSRDCFQWGAGEVVEVGLTVRVVGLAEE